MLLNGASLFWDTDMETTGLVVFLVSIFTAPPNKKKSPIALPFFTVINQTQTHLLSAPIRVLK